MKCESCGCQLYDEEVTGDGAVCLPCSDAHFFACEAEYQDAERAAADAARRGALADDDFAALEAAYVAGPCPERTLEGLLRDRLLDLGISDDVADAVMLAVWQEHPANEIPF